jgi:hypothetical protein
MSKALMIGGPLDGSYSYIPVPDAKTDGPRQLPGQAFGDDLYVFFRPLSGPNVGQLAWHYCGKIRWKARRASLVQ